MLGELGVCLLCLCCGPGTGVHCPRLCCFLPGRALCGLVKSASDGGPFLTVRPAACAGSADEAAPRRRGHLALHQGRRHARAAAAAVAYQVASCSAHAATAQGLARRGRCCCPIAAQESWRSTQEQHSREETTRCDVPATICSWYARTRRWTQQRSHRKGGAGDKGCAEKETQDKDSTAPAGHAHNDAYARHAHAHEACARQTAAAANRIGGACSSRAE